MDRLLKKWETAKSIVPRPELRQDSTPNECGIIFFGTSIYSSEEAVDILATQDIQMDSLRLRAFPFPEAVEQFIADHELIFVIEQNRDAQMRSLLINELGVAPQKMIPILNYDGMPITADTIVKQIIKNFATV